MHRFEEANMILNDISPESFEHTSEIPNFQIYIIIITRPTEKSVGLNFCKFLERLEEKTWQQM